MKLACMIAALSLTACGDKEPSASTGGGGTTSDEGASTGNAGGNAGGDALTQVDFNERVFGAIEKAGSAKVHFETESAGTAQGVEGDGEVEYGDQIVTAPSSSWRFRTSFSQVS